MLKIFGKTFSSKVKKIKKTDKAKTWFETFFSLFWNLIIQPLRFLAPVFGFALAAIKLVFILFGFIFSIIAISSTILFQSIFQGALPIASLSKKIDANTAIEIRIDDNLASSSVGGLQEAIISGERFGLLNTLEAIRRATVDPRIKGIYLCLDGGSLGIAEFQELRRALKRFKKNKKWVVTYADQFPLGTSLATLHYYVASVSDEIWLHHFGIFAPTGFMFQVPLGKELLEKVKVTPHFITKHEYKTYPQMFTHSELSPENQEVLKEQMNGVSRTIIHGIAKGRSLSFVEANAIVDSAPLSDRDALKEGYVDKLVYTDEIPQLLKKRYSVTNILRVKDYFGLMDLPDDLNGITSTMVAATQKANTVVIVPLKGVIASDDGTHTQALTPRYVRKAIARARQKNPGVIVFQIDSPGGDPLPSEMIYRQIAELSKKTPVVALLSNVAGSGGYWIATAADKIIASPTTITGSIGVLLGKFELTNLWKYIGLNWGVIRSHEGSGALSSSEGFSPQVLQKLDTLAEYMYDRFVDRVAQSRKLDVTHVERIARGRTWLGRDAKRHKLVDSVGGYMGALKECAQILTVDASELHVETVGRPLSVSAILRNAVGVYVNKIITPETKVTLQSPTPPLTLN